MKIGIIGAMEEELTLIKNKLLNPSLHEISQQHFWTGTLHGMDVVITKCGIGKVNTAIGTTLLNHCFNPNYVINTGTAGGLSSTLNVGDIIIPSEICYYDVDLTVFGYKIGQMAQMPPVYFPDANLVKIAEKCFDQQVQNKITRGLLVSGDSFVSTKQQIAYIKDNFENAIAIEMEACAIAQVCYALKVPFIIIRCISDIVGNNNKINHEQFLHIAADKSAKLVLSMLEKTYSS